MYYFDIVDLNLSRFGTLVPATPCCVFYARRHQFYRRFNTDDMVFDDMTWFLTQNKIMVTVSAALPSPDHHSAKSYVKKISVYFLAICADFPCKTEKFELEVAGVGILGTGFCVQGSH